MACDRYYLENVNQWFQDAVDVSDADIVIAVPKGSTKVKSLPDLIQPGIRVAVGEPSQCTIGALTRRLLVKEGLYDKLKEKQKQPGEVVVEKSSSALDRPGRRHRPRGRGDRLYHGRPGQPGYGGRAPHRLAPEPRHPAVQHRQDERSQASRPAAVPEDQPSRPKRSRRPAFISAFRPDRKGKLRRRRSPGETGRSAREKAQEPPSHERRLQRPTPSNLSDTGTASEFERRLGPAAVATRDRAVRHRVLHRLGDHRRRLRPADPRPAGRRRRLHDPSDRPRRRRLAAAVADGPDRESDSGRAGRSARSSIRSG